MTYLNYFCHYFKKFRFHRQTLETEKKRFFGCSFGFKTDYKTETEKHEKTDIQNRNQNRKHEKNEIRNRNQNRKTDNGKNF